MREEVRGRGRTGKLSAASQAMQRSRKMWIGIDLLDLPCNTSFTGDLSPSDPTKEKQI